MEGHRLLCPAFLQKRLIVVAFEDAADKEPRLWNVTAVFGFILCFSVIYRKRFAAVSCPPIFHVYKTGFPSFYLHVVSNYL